MNNVLFGAISINDDKKEELIGLMLESLSKSMKTFDTNQRVGWKYALKIFFSNFKK